MHGRIVICTRSIGVFVKEKFATTGNMFITETLGGLEKLSNDETLMIIDSIATSTKYEHHYRPSPKIFPTPLTEESITMLS